MKVSPWLPPPPIFFTAAAITSVIKHVYKKSSAYICTPKHAGIIVQYAHKAKEIEDNTGPVEDEETLDIMSASKLEMLLELCDPIKVCHPIKDCIHQVSGFFLDFLFLFLCF